MKADGTGNKKADAPANELNANDLENVSGGLWGITIIDQCTNRFDEKLCLECFGGYCPQLSIVDRKLDMGYKGGSKEEYTLTCKKGCYRNLKFYKSTTYDPFTD